MYSSSFSRRGASRGSGRGGRCGRGGRGGRGGSRGGNHGFNNRDAPSPAMAGTESRPGATPTAGPRRRKNLVPGHKSPKHIFQHFNPSAEIFERKLLGTINASEEKPDGIAFALIFVENQPHWMRENVVHVKSRLDLLPEYGEKKVLLAKQHKAPSHDELMERIAAHLTESIKFDRYGIEDGPDVELFDEEGNITSLIVPGEWMAEDHELPTFAAVDTPSVKYAPAAHEPIAAYAGYGNEPDRTGFKFVAWFLIQEVELFAPNSVALARKMKYKKRNADIGREWAAVKLLRVEKGDPEWRPSPHSRPDLAQDDNNNGFHPDEDQPQHEDGNDSHNPAKVADEEGKLDHSAQGKPEVTAAADAAVHARKEDTPVRPKDGDNDAGGEVGSDMSKEEKPAKADASHNGISTTAYTKSQESEEQKAEPTLSEDGGKTVAAEPTHEASLKVCQGAEHTERVDLKDDEKAVNAEQVALKMEKLELDELKVEDFKRE